MFPDGRKFDSSRDRGEPLRFKAGLRQVIPAWDWAISQMSVGQRVMLITPPAFAYGARGSPGVIPPNATLVFDIELVDIN
jgi:FKBP-type peptidyl-prolyl cis-trans isomerase